MVAFALLLTSLAYAGSGQPLDIRSFGVTCDGTDEAAAVQVALDTLAEGNTLLIPCQVGIGAPGLELRDKTAVAIRGVENGGFRALRRSSLSVGGFSPVLFAVRNCTRCLIQSIVFDMNGVAEAAVGLDSSVETLIRNNHVQRVGFPAPAGIVGVKNRECVYTGNFISGTGKGASDGTRGMWIGNGGGQEEWRPLVSANNVEDAGATGIVVYGQGVTVSSNVVTRAGGAGIKVNTGALPEDREKPQNRLDTNVLRHNLFHGIQVERGEGGMRIDGNRLEMNAVAGLYVSGGEFSGRISGNTISGNREAGIYLYDAAGVTIEANQIGSITATPQRFGIVLEAITGGSVRDVKIARNEIWDQTYDGISLRARGGRLEGIEVESNAIGGTSRSGVYVEAQAGSQVGALELLSNCFDLQLSRTVIDARSAGLSIPRASDCAAARPASDQ